jgi:hypothetical protein
MQATPPFGPTLWSKSVDKILYTHESRDHHGCEHSVGLDRVSHAGQKFFNLIKNRVLIADKREMIVAG